MCCNNRQRESWVVGLVVVGCLFSLLVASAMIMVTYPGDECLLFVRYNLALKYLFLIFGLFEAEYSHSASLNFFSLYFS